MKQFFISLKKFGGDIVDLFQPKNRVKITITNVNTGKIDRIITGRNIVTGFLSGTSNKSGRDFMRRLLIPHTESDSFQGALVNNTDGYWVDVIKLGTGTTAEDSTQTGLATHVSAADKDIATYTLSTSATEVTFKATWGAGDANGNTFSEAGLYSNKTGAVEHFIARKTFTPFNKTSDFEFSIEWTLRF